MMSILGLALILGGQVLPVPSEPSSADIVVTAAKPPAPEAARRFVRSISIESDGQLARFVGPVCPRVLGLEEVAGRAIETRFRMVAHEAGIEVDAPDCRPNAYVIFNQDGHALIEQLYQERVGWFDGLTSAELARLRTEEGPVRVWRSTSLRNEDGQLVRGGFLRVMTSSFVNPQTQQAIDGAVIVLDNQATLGKSLRQIADYAVIRLLAKTRPPANAADAATILSLFDAGDAQAPVSMTSVDQQYLRALYQGPANRGASVKKSDIAAAVSRAPKR
ncbi:MAG: hypothetical protein K2X59_04410 [Sphingomonas sp.]|nr:hypothetical protein [Sphingomonas sp.]